MASTKIATESKHIPDGNIADFDDPFRRRIISSAGTLLGAILVSGMIARYLVAKIPFQLLFIGFSIALVLLLLPLLIRRNVGTNICGMLLILSINIIGFISGISNGGMAAPAAVIFVISPIIGFLCTGTKGAQIALAISSISMVLLLLLEHFGINAPILNPEKFTLYKTIVYFFVSLLVYTIGAVYEKSRRTTEKFMNDLLLKNIQLSKMSTLGEMAGGISHEINNPLTIIIGKIFKVNSLLNVENIDLEKIKVELSKIESTAHRIEKIVKGLKHFSRNDLTDPFELVSASSVIDSSLELCNEKLKNNSIELRMNLNSNLMIQCRPIQISQIILNLLMNANDSIEFIDEKWISIDLSELNDKVKISITDSGKGIPPEIVEKMMQPFFTTKGVGKGTGLGLSISLGIAESHHGKLYYDSDSKNTKFVLELPSPNSNSHL